ncbi:MAG: YraN family protein [Cryobacterium sp.]
MARKDDLGRRGEDYAVAYLERTGYRVIARNWRCPEGEIDVIVEQSGMVAFVEVKTRTSTRFGHPFEAITAVKLARMRRLAAAWCARSDTWPHRIRLDVIAVITGPVIPRQTGPGADQRVEPIIEHLTGVL